MSEITSKKKSKTPLLLIVVFVLPVILAKLALDNDWFNRASTNKGELMSPILDASSLMVEMEPKWRILYLLPQNCEAECENAIYSINQVWVASGKESDRVEPVIISVPDSDQDKTTELSGHPNIKLLKQDGQSVNNVFKDVPANGIFLVDTLNNVILRYPLFEEQKQAVMKSRDILADIKKLLKLSRIG